MTPLTVGSLFSGIGGFELGLERTGGFKTVWQCEIDPFCLKVLEKHWPGVKRFADIKKMGVEEEIPHVDVICGGFPCQDISCAGKGAGIHAERSGLWWEMLRVVRLVRPRYVLVENVAALLNRGLDEVLGSLAESGYDAEWQMLSAAEFGAPHIRSRLFIISYSMRDGFINESCFKPGRFASKKYLFPRRWGELAIERLDSCVPPRLSFRWESSARNRRAVDGISSGIHIDRFISHETRSSEKSTKSNSRQPMSNVWENGSEIESTSPGSSESVGCDDSLHRMSHNRRSEVGESENKENCNLCDLREPISSKGFPSSQNVLGEVLIRSGNDQCKQEMAQQQSRLRALGNAIVPQCSQFVGQCLLDSIRTEAAQ
jgi:DNA (cytosine-5)-methyltransferase 1